MVLFVIFGDMYIPCTERCGRGWLGKIVAISFLPGCFRYLSPHWVTWFLSLEPSIPAHPDSVALPTSPQCFLVVLPSDQLWASKGSGTSSMSYTAPSPSSAFLSKAHILQPTVETFSYIICSRLERTSFCKSKDLNLPIFLPDAWV